MSAATSSSSSSLNTAAAGEVNASNGDDAEKETIRKIVVEISKDIKDAEKDLRSKYSIFKKDYQDIIGMSIFLISFAGIFASWFFYFKCTWLSYCVNAIISTATIMMFTSFLHELEHDLIHNLYFRIIRGEAADITTKNAGDEKIEETTKTNRRIQDFMFLCIWIIKLHGNPWFRRDLHLRHHRISGQKDDAEERLIGLGKCNSTI